MHPLPTKFPPVAMATILGRYASALLGQTPESLIPRVMINFRPNNLFVHVLDPEDPSRSWLNLSAGHLGFQGATKTTPKAALTMMDRLESFLKSKSVNTVNLEFRGINPSRSVIIGQLRRTGLKVQEIIDSTPFPFN